MERINSQFNDDLQKQIDGNLPIGYTYQLGNSGAILQSAGMPDFPIELQSTTLRRKSDANYKKSHPFDLADVKDLPKAIQNPIMVFDDADNVNNMVILTGLKSNGVNFVVAMRLGYKKKSRAGVVEVNSVRSLFPKDRVSDILEWVNRGLLRYVDKNEALEFLEELRIATQKSSGNTKATTLFQKVVTDFVNPDFPTKQDTSF